MKIIILGAGQVGGTLAEHLANEQNDITVVDTDGEKLRALQDRLDIGTVTGGASHPNILYKAGVPSGEGKILLLGWSYKAEVGDPRETPAEPLAEALQAKNIAISAFDPHLRPEDFPAGIEVVDDINSAQGYDLAVLVTAHQACLEIDWSGLSKRMNNPILYDGRRVLDLAKLENEGWKIHAVGRP